MCRSRRRRLAAATAALGLAAAVATSGGGSTYAAFSDFVIEPGNHLTGAHVTVGVPDARSSPPSYADLLPGVPQTETLVISYTGSVPGDLALELRPEDGSAYCEHGPDDWWRPRPGGAVQLSVGDGWWDYCSLLGRGAAVQVATDVPAGSVRHVQVSVRLAPGSDFRYSEFTDVDGLTVTARQSGLGPFHDWTVGRITIATGSIPPPTPTACEDPGDDECGGPSAPSVEEPGAPRPTDATGADSSGDGPRPQPLDPLALFPGESSGTEVGATSPAGQESPGARADPAAQHPDAAVEP